MVDTPHTQEQLHEELRSTKARLEEAEEALRAIQQGEVDALVVNTDQGEQIFTLQGAEHPYRVMIESIAEGTATLLPDGTILYSNHRLAEMLSIPLENLIGSNFSTYIHPADFPLYEALLKHGLNESQKDEIQLLCIDGNILPVLASMSPLPVDNTGGVCLIATDLTQQKRTNEIVAAERITRSILQQAAEAIIVCDAKGTIIRANTSAYKLAGRTPVFTPFNKAYPLIIENPEGGSPRFSIEAVLEGSSYLGIQAHFKPISTGRLNERHSTHVQMSATPFLNEEGQIIGCIVMLTDNTVLKESQELLSLASESAEMGVWSWDLIKDEFIWDSQARKIFNVPADIPITYAKFIELIHPADRARVDEEIHKVLKNQQDYETEFRIRWADGSEHWVYAKGKAHFSGIDTPERLMGVYYDETARMVAEQELRSQMAKIDAQHRLMDYREKERLQIARDIHDGPLQELIAISFAIQGVLTDLQGKPPFDSIKMIQGSLLHQISELRSFAGELRPPSLSTFGVEFAIRSHIETFNEKHPEIHVSFESDIIGLSAPETVRLAMFRIYQELMNNVVKHSQATQVSIRLTQKDHQIELLVADNGNGFTVPISIDANNTGGHLGLVGMMERAEAVGGKLILESTPGEGTTARVVVPISHSP